VGERHCLHLADSRALPGPEIRGRPGAPCGAATSDPAVSSQPLAGADGAPELGLLPSRAGGEAKQTFVALLPVLLKNTCGSPVVISPPFG